MQDQGAVGAVYEATMETSGQRFAAPAAQTLLRSAEAAGITLPSACRNGTCRTCLRPLRTGTVRYAIAWPGLLPEEKTGGWVLPCVAHPESDLVLGD